MVATTEEMIDLVSFYVLERQIGIAELLACEFLDDCSSSPLKQSGYAILSIAMAYFEMIEQFSQGRESSQGESTSFFMAGFRKVYPCSPLSNDDIRQIYKWIRCGMYHGGMTRYATRLSRFFPEGFALSGGEIHINPGRVVEEIKSHFLGYVATLRNPCCSYEREAFRRYCEALGVGEAVSDYVHSSTTQLTKTTPAPWEQG